MLLESGQVLAIVSGGTDQYNPASGMWATTTPAPPGGGNFAGLLPNGFAFFVDAFYDLSTAQWTTFAQPTSQGGFAVLQSGEVLAAGNTFEVNAGKAWRSASARKISC